MSFIRSGKPVSSFRRKRSGVRKKPAWDDSINDLSVHKASLEDQIYRKNAHVSKNSLSARLQRLERNQKKAKSPKSSARQKAVMKEILYDQQQLHDVLSRSDQMMAVVQDLFGDDPRRFAGFPNVTTAPGNSDPTRSGRVVASDPDVRTQLEMLSESMMNGTALNTSSEDEDSAEDGPEPIVYKPHLNLDRFQQFLASEEGSLSTISGGGGGEGLVTSVDQGAPAHSTRLPDGGSVTTGKGSGDGSIFETPPQKKSGSQLYIPKSAANDTAKVKRSKKHTVDQEPVTKASSLSLEDLKQVLIDLQGEISELERQTGRSMATDHAHGDTFSGYTMALVDSVTRLTRHLRETDLRLRAETTVREQLTQDVVQLGSVVDALTADIILTQEEYSRVTSEFTRYKTDTQTELQQIRAMLEDLCLGSSKEQTAEIPQLVSQHQQFQQQSTSQPQQHHLPGNQQQHQQMKQPSQQFQQQSTSQTQQHHFPGNQQQQQQMKQPSQQFQQQSTSQTQQHHLPGNQQQQQQQPSLHLANKQHQSQVVVGQQSESHQHQLLQKQSISQVPSHSQQSQVSLQPHVPVNQRQAHMPVSFQSSVPVSQQQPQGNLLQQQQQQQQTSQLNQMNSEENVERLISWERFQSNQIPSVHSQTNAGLVTPPKLQQAGHGRAISDGIPPRLAAASHQLIPAAVLLSPPVQRTRVPQRQHNVVERDPVTQQQSLGMIDSDEQVNVGPNPDPFFQSTAVVNVPRPVRLVQTNVPVNLRQTESCSSQALQRQTEFREDTNLQPIKTGLQHHGQPSSISVDLNKENYLSDPSVSAFRTVGSLQSNTIPTSSQVVLQQTESEDVLRKTTNLDQKGDNPVLSAQIAELNRQHEEAQQRLQAMIQQQQMHHLAVVKSQKQGRQIGKQFGEAHKQTNNISDQVSPDVSPISDRSSSVRGALPTNPSNDQISLHHTEEPQRIMVSMPRVDLDLSQFSDFSPNNRANSQPDFRTHRAEACQ